MRVIIDPKNPEIKLAGDYHFLKSSAILCLVDTEQVSSVIENRVSVGGSKLYLDGRASHWLPICKQLGQMQR